MLKLSVSDDIVSSILVYQNLLLSCIAFLLYLDDVMRAFQKKRGLDYILLFSN